MAYSYLFVLGRTPLLAAAELKRFFPDPQIISPEIVIVASPEALSATDWIGRLGGTVKIARELGTVGELTPGEIVRFLPETPEVRFGISVYGGMIPKTLLSGVKELLGSRGIRAQYLASRHGNALSSVAVDKKHATELIVVPRGREYLVGITEAVHEYESWSRRDYGRPFADPKAGMLPPKVARMAVNLARLGKTRTLLDPFCGMGTVLAEAYSIGWRVIGSDVDERVVAKAKANLSWFAREAKGGEGEIVDIMVCDAVHISDKLPPGSIDAIVTEPFMGSTNIANEQKIDAAKVKNIIKGLEKLYIGCLREWSSLLVSGGVVVIALPEYAIGGRVYFVKKVIDMCENLGYTIEDGPIEYSRPHATVRRKFFVFRKK